MGSLNDLVLHKNGQPLTKENDELDKLRTKFIVFAVSREKVRSHNKFVTSS
jgi:hypothetical protein